MRVQVVLKGSLANRLPEGRGFVELPEESSVQAILPGLGLPQVHCVFVVNGAPVTRDAKLQEGCRVEVFPPMAGGA